MAIVIGSPPWLSASHLYNASAIYKETAGFPLAIPTLLPIDGNLDPVSYPTRSSTVNGLFTFNSSSSTANVFIWRYVKGYIYLYGRSGTIIGHIKLPYAGHVADTVFYSTSPSLTVYSGLEGNRYEIIRYSNNIQIKTNAPMNGVNWELATYSSGTVFSTITTGEKEGIWKYNSSSSNNPKYDFMASYYDDSTLSSGEGYNSDSTIGSLIFRQNNRRICRSTNFGTTEVKANGNYVIPVYHSNKEYLTGDKPLKNLRVKLNNIEGVVPMVAAGLDSSLLAYNPSLRTQLAYKDGTTTSSVITKAICPENRTSTISGSAHYAWKACSYKLASGTIGGFPNSTGTVTPIIFDAENTSGGSKVWGISGYLTIYQSYSGTNTLCEIYSVTTNASGVPTNHASSYDGYIYLSSATSPVYTYTSGTKIHVMFQWAETSNSFTGNAFAIVPRGSIPAMSISDVCILRGWESGANIMQ